MIEVSEICEQSAPSEQLKSISDNKLNRHAGTCGLELLPRDILNDLGDTYG